MSSITEERFVLPPDLITVPLRHVDPSTRKRIGGMDDDVAVNRPGSRALTRVLDAGMAGLLREFETPSRVVEAILRFSVAEGLDPLATLDEAFDSLNSLINANFLLRADGVEAAPTAATWSPGEMVAGFRVQREVQVLEDTELYLATDPSGQAVALKMGREQDSTLIRYMLDHERAVLERLRGTVTPAVVACGDVDGRPYLVMQWREGEPVTGQAVALRRLPDRERDIALRRLCVGVLDAYASIHHRGVLHGDVHPGNILVTADGDVSIIDFGRASIVGGDAGDGVAIRAGVPVYYEPEFGRAWLEERLPPPPTPAGEQYALAALLYVLLTGRYYLEFSPDHAVLCRQILQEPPLPFVRRGREPWPEMERILGKAFAQEPSDRFPDLDAFRDAVASCPISEPTAPPRQPGLNDEVDAFVDFLRLEGEIFARGLVDAPTGSVSSGAAGVAWFLYRMALLRDDPALLAAADAWSARIDTGAAEEGVFTSQERGLTSDLTGSTSPLHTASGVHCIRALIARARGDRGVFAREARAYMAYQDRVDHRLDMSFGMAGSLAGLALLLDGPVDADSRLRGAMEEAAIGLRDALVARIEGLPAIPDERMVRHLGMAHGWAGILLAILRASRVSGAPVPDAIVARLDQLTACSRSVGEGLAWPVSVEDRRTLPTPGDLSGGWCRGSAGYVHLWTAAHDAFPARGYLGYAEGAARYAWVHEGHQTSLCCGLAGRALALARLYRATGDGEWLARARELSVRAWRSAPQRDDPDLGLFHGRLGVALALAELDDPLFATVPLFGDEGW